MDSDHNAEWRHVMSFAVLDVTQSIIILLLVFTWAYRFYFLFKFGTLPLET